jgi:hypothetical protein
VNHVLVKVGSKVVIRVLGDVVPLGLRLGSSHYELVAVSSLADLDASHGGCVIGVRAEVLHRVFDIIAERRLLVLILGAARRGSDRV